MMTKRQLTIATVAVFVLGLAGSLSAAGPGSRGRLDVPAVPANLEVPAGHTAFLHGQAIGTQNYICLATATGMAWKFIGPQATLFLSARGGFDQQLTTHYLSANPGENGLARPTWLHSFDSSQVWGKVAASSTDPNYVAAGAIPWLLVEAAGVATGPEGGAALTRTTYIQRVNTSGGIAPSAGCSQPADTGVMALVPYTTDYFFYRAKRRP